MIEYSDTDLELRFSLRQGNKISLVDFAKEDAESELLERFLKNNVTDLLSSNFNCALVTQGEKETGKTTFFSQRKFIEAVSSSVFKSIDSYA